MVSAINRIIDNVISDHRLGMLHNLLGYIYRLAGNFQQAIDCHQKAGDIAATFNQAQSKVSTLLNFNSPDNFKLLTVEYGFQPSL